MSMDVLVKGIEVEIREEKEEKQRLTQYGELLQKNVWKEEEKNYEV